LLAGEEPSLLENSEHIIFVVLHLGKNAAPSVAYSRFISSSRDSGAMKIRPKPRARIGDRPLIPAKITSRSL
jgi:hypothetical protein